MARQRMISPAFFVDEDVARMSPLARLMFQGLWTLADKRGRLEDRPARIKVQTLPYDECDPDGLLSEIASGGFIVRYEAQGRKLVQIRSFNKHQRPHPKEPDSTIPEPPPDSAEDKRGDSRPAGTVCAESVPSVPSVPSGPSEHVPGGPVPGEPEQGAPSLGLVVEMPELSEYGAAIVEEWHELRGSAFPQPSNRDFTTLSEWHAANIPLKVAIRGMTDCFEGMRKRGDKGLGKPLAYYSSSVRAAYEHWRKAIA